MTAAAPAVSANPFLALRSFRREDSFCFFGRDADLILVQSRLFSSRCTLLFAASGVGKSSFLDAKLAPAIESQWRIVTHRAWASNAPLPGLLASIAPGAPGGAEPGVLRNHVERLLEAEGGKRGCLIVLDQFEEVFQHWRDSRALDDFAAEVASVVHAPGLEARVLISMREEFVGELSIFDNLIPDLFNNCYRLKNATRSEAEEIIARTAQLGGAVCGEGFDRLLDDLVRSSSRFSGSRGSHPGSSSDESPRSRIPMPFLQIVCYRLWREQMLGPDGKVTGTRFLERAPGSVRDELEAYCHEKLQALSEPEQDLVSAAFSFLMTRSGAKMAYPVDVLAQQARVDERRLLSVLAKLSDENVRILRKVPGHDAKPWFELYHDLYAQFLSDWKRERDATREQRENWKWRLVVIALLVASAATVAGLTIWRASVARDRLLSSQSTELADRLRLFGESLAPRDGAMTSRHVRFALESYARVPAAATRDTLLNAVNAPVVETAEAAVPENSLAALSADGRFVAVSTPDGVRLTSLADGGFVAQLNRAALVSALAFSPDGGTLAVAAWDGKIDLVASTTGRPIKSIEVIKNGLINAITYSPDGKLIAAAADSYDNFQQVVQVHAIDTGAMVATVPHAKVATALAFSPNSRYLLTGSDDGIARVVDIARGGQRVYPHKSKVIAIAVSPDSRTFATSSQDGVVQTADLTAGKPTMTLLTNPSSAVAPALAFSPQGRYLATGQGLLWDRASRTGQPMEIRGAVSALAFTPDDRLIAAAGAEGASLLSTETRTSLVRLASGPSEIVAIDPQGAWFGLRVGQAIRVFRIKSAGGRAPADDAELEAMACALTTEADTTRVKEFLGTEPALACVPRS